MQMKSPMEAFQPPLLQAEEEAHHHLLKRLHLPRKSTLSSSSTSLLTHFFLLAKKVLASRRKFSERSKNVVGKKNKFVVMSLAKKNPALFDILTHLDDLSMK